MIHDFASAVLRRVPPAQLASADPEAVAAAVADAFAFVDSRRPHEVAVRMIDPELTLDGRRPAGTILEVSCEDRQFIVSTVKEELHQLGQRVGRLLHPVFGSERTADGRLAAVSPARDAPHRDSFLQVELSGRFPAGARRALVEAIKDVLHDVFAATDDFVAMREQVAAVAAEVRDHAGRRYAADEVLETADLLHWVLDDNFVLLGTASDGERLGVAFPTPASADDGTPPLLRLTRTAQTSRVHRQVPMHRIDVVRVDGRGEVAGTFRVAGVFSDKANAEPAVVTPVLRWKLRRILELEDVVPGSHDESALVSLFQLLPKEELFDSDVATLRQTIVGLLAAEDQQDVRVRLRVEPATRTVSALLSIPQELYSSALRRRLERFLIAQLDGARVDAQVALGDRADAVLRLVVHVDGALPTSGLDQLEREVRLLCRTWDQELAAALTARLGEARGRQLAQLYDDWFPSVYRDAVTTEAAVDDVVELDRLRASPDGAGVGIVLTPDRTGRAEARFKVFVAGPPVELSSLLPIVESLGLWAVEEAPWTLGGGDAAVHLHDFGVRRPDGGATRLDVDRDGPRLAEAALALWSGRAEVDGLNRLVMAAAMPWEDVAVLRAYRRYRSQVGTSFTTGYVDDVLVGNPQVSRAIVDLFAARFDTACAEDGEREAADAVRARIEELCDTVPRLDHDRILRGIGGLVDATVRTNRYLPGAGDHLALKIDSALVPDMPRPVPFREIFVHGPAVEGIHLRWGPVARGGIRWSDRPDDYRNEVLGLMRAQVLKNAVIVPTGAKGGFIVKRGRHGPGDVAQAYETFIASLIEVTQGDTDSYLVVAADRGTAKFSDLANRVSEKHNFWLGDAFASGGSRGYDHKALGITARGAWVAVRHHFAELGIDLDAEPVTAVGIGDMSGDVFGNAMLQSDRIRLVAAFDHRHVFVDPDPDPALSHKERIRLYELPGSSWDDYDRQRLSLGGGVWSRLDKRIDLSPQARRALGMEADHLTPAELIRAILTAPVGLLFAGGIGTFVRSSAEPDQEIDDRANSEVRVTASQVRTRVVGEGANLAFTQRARIEYARRGGRINTDAIDNSAAVDISDREVNLKILLRAAVDGGDLTFDERDQVLTEVCEDVVAAVLDDCRQQSLALSRAQAASPLRMDAIEALLVELEGAAVLDRGIEALPSTEEMQARAQAGAGLTRPELAVLLAGAKRRLAAQVLGSAIPDQPALRVALVRYFPKAIRERFDHLLDRHPLRRELIAAVVANDLVNRMGATFVSRLAGETGAAPERIVAAYCIAWGVAGAGRRWDAAAATGLSALLEALTRDYVRRGEGADIAAAVVRDRPTFVDLEAAMPDIGSPARRRRRTRRAEAWLDSGVDPAAAVSWACLEELEIVPDIGELVRQTGRPAREVAEAFLRTGEALGLDRLVEQLRKAAVSDHWARAAWQGLFDDLDDLRRQATARAFAEHPERDAADAVARFLAARSGPVHEALALVRAIEAGPTARLDAIAVATRAVRRGISPSAPPLS